MLTKKKGMKGKVLPIILALLLVFNFTSAGAVVMEPTWEKPVCSKYEEKDGNLVLESGDTDISPWVEISLEGEDDELFNWNLTQKAIDEGIYVTSVTVKGGPEEIVYPYGENDTGDTKLVAPINPGGQQAAVSNVTICLDKKVPPPPAPEGTLEVTKEVLGLDNGSTPDFDIIVRDTDLEVVHTFNLGNGDSDTVDLEVGTYFLRESVIPNGYALVGYYEDDGETPITPTIGDPAIYIELEITEDGTTSIIVRNEVVELVPEGTLEVTKEVLGLDNGSTPDFDIIVRDTDLDVVHTFNLGNGDSDTFDLAPGTYYLMETGIPSGYELEGYYRDVGEGLLLLDIIEDGDKADHVMVSIFEDVTTRIFVRNNVVETPGNGDNGNGTDPGNGTGTTPDGDDNVIVPPVTQTTTEPATEEPVVIEPEPEVDVPAEEPEEEIIIIQEPAPALPDTGANNLAIRTLGFLALAAGVTLHLLDRRRIKE